MDADGVHLEAFPARKELWQHVRASPGLFVFLEELATNFLALQSVRTGVANFAGMSRRT